MTLKIGDVFSDIPLTEKELAYVEKIKENNTTHIISENELKPLISKANQIYYENWNGGVWFERSIFTNWTCGIADCRYCYLSTKPKLEKNALRSAESILAEALLCTIMNWKVGYLTGGLRVESTEYMTELLKDVGQVLGYKPMMNYGPYAKQEILSFKPHISGMGSAIESFDEELHQFICPSKPLKALLKYLKTLQDEEIPSFITIILGIGEKKTDVEHAIEQIKKYNISMVQLCFLKPQEKTPFETIHPPQATYMAWWTAKLRIALPTLIIKIALVQDRVDDFSLMLRAGANCFSRYFIFKDFASQFTQEIKNACITENRTLKGEFEQIPHISYDKLKQSLPFEPQKNEIILLKLKQYISRLQKRLTTQSTTSH